MRRLRHSAQVLIIFALAMPALLGMLDLGLEVAFALGERQRMQAAADAAALNGIYCVIYSTQDCLNAAKFNPGDALQNASPGDSAKGMALLAASVNGYRHVGGAGNVSLLVSRNG